jgi:AcrR family transcriptional regulator
VTNADVTVTAEPGPARTRTPSALVEQALVDAAEVVLVRDGPTAVTVRAVAAQAGVAPMGIYSRLGGKDGLIDALLIRGFDLLRAAVEPRGETDPIEALRASGIRYRGFALAHPQYYAVMFGDAIPQTQVSPQVADHAAACLAELVAYVEDALAAGAITTGDSLEIAQQIWSTVHGATALELTGSVVTPDPQASYHALIDTLIRGLAR